MVSSSSPGTGRLPTIVTVAKPLAASTARAVLARTAPPVNPPEGSPTSSPSPASARHRVASIHRSTRRRPVTRSAARTSAGDAPIVTSVARLTEVSATAAK